MSDQNDPKTSDSKDSKPRHDTSEIVDRPRTGSDKDSSKDAATRPEGRDIKGDSPRVGEEPRKALESKPEIKKYEQPRK